MFNKWRPIRRLTSPVYYPKYIYYKSFRPMCSFFNLRDFHPMLGSFDVLGIVEYFWRLFYNPDAQLETSLTAYITNLVYLFVGFSQWSNKTLIKIIYFSGTDFILNEVSVYTKFRATTKSKGFNNICIWTVFTNKFVNLSYAKSTKADIRSRNKL